MDSLGKLTLCCSSSVQETTRSLSKRPGVWNYHICRCGVFRIPVPILWMGCMDSCKYPVLYTRYPSDESRLLHRCHYTELLYRGSNARHNAKLQLNGCRDSVGDLDAASTRGIQSGSVPGTLRGGSRGSRGSSGRLSLDVRRRIRGGDWALG